MLKNVTNVCQAEEVIEKSTLKRKESEGESAVTSEVTSEVKTVSSDAVPNSESPIAQKPNTSSGICSDSDTKSSGSSRKRDAENIVEFSKNYLGKCGDSKLLFAAPLYEDMSDDEENTEPVRKCRKVAPGTRFYSFLDLPAHMW